MSGADGKRRGISARTARTMEYTIVGASILFTLGAAAIVIVGLAFNIVPLCQPGKSVRSLVIAGIVIVVIFVIVTVLALASAELYAYYISPDN